MNVPDPAFPSLAENKLLTRFSQIGDQLQLGKIRARNALVLWLIRILRGLGEVHKRGLRPIGNRRFEPLLRGLLRHPVNNRSNGNGNHLVGPRLAGTLFAHPVLPVAGFQNRLVEKGGEVVDMGLSPENNAASTATVPAVRPAPRHK